MIMSLPSVQRSCKDARRIVTYRASAARKDKRSANRVQRRYMNAVTKQFERDDELFDDEPFSSPSFSSWDIC